jgi:hypothetical protein
VKAHLQAAEKDAFALSSNLFGRVATVNVQLAGIQDPVQQVRMKALVTELLGRHQIGIDAKEGSPLLLSYQAAGKNGVEKASWTVELKDEAGQQQQARFATTIPTNARASVYESSLVAALNANLGELKSWLNVD